MATALIEVRRLQSDEARGTLGALYLNGDQFCFTVEPPFRGNRPDDPGTPENDASCIPPGGYTGVVRADDKWPRVVELVGVRGRSGILIHSAGTWRDSKGCIGIGWHEAGQASFLQWGTLRNGRSLLRALCSKIGKGPAEVIVRGVAESKPKG